MAKKDLVEYVETGLRKGRHVKHIKRKLARHGHNVSDIEEAVRHVLLTKPYLKRYRHRMFAGIFLTAAVVILIFFIFTYEEGEKVIEYKENLTYSGKTDIELLKLAAEKEDLVACRYIEDDTYQIACDGRYWETNDCVYIRLIGEDVYACLFRQEVGEELFDKYCVPFTFISQCRQAIAVGENDLSYCGEFTGCRINIAVETVNVSICKDLSPEDFSSCFTRVRDVSSDPAICNLVNSSKCLFNVLPPKARADISNEFYQKYATNGELPEDKYNEYIKNLFDTKHSEETCEYITGMHNGFALKDVCYYFEVEDTFYASKRIKEAKEFNSEKMSNICSKIFDSFLRGCCDSIANENIIKEDCAVVEAET